MFANRQKDAQGLLRNDQKYVNGRQRKTLIRLLITIPLTIWILLLANNSWVNFATAVILGFGMGAELLFTMFSQKTPQLTSMLGQVIIGIGLMMTAFMISFLDLYLFFGISYLGPVIILVAVSDIMALTWGRGGTWLKRFFLADPQARLTPIVPSNPSKSWLGSLGATFTVGLIVFFNFPLNLISQPAMANFFVNLNINFSLLPRLSGFVIGLLATSSDLLNSLIKRRYGIKDWMVDRGLVLLGEHGGILDRFCAYPLPLLVMALWSHL